jgi:trimethylamine--corrinoid protein Co-methyltransferase
MSDGLIEMATWGQPVVATPFTLAGAMTPATLAGALAQQNAEALFMIALAQIVRPGAPMVYGGFTSNVDMRTGSPAFGTPEFVKGAIATGQLARRYALPHRSSNVTGSAVVDAQAAYESGMSIWGSIMGGVSLLYQGAGWLEGGLTASFEKLILDAEMLQQMAEVLVPFAVDDDALGSMRSRRWVRVATSSARPTRWPASRPPSTSRCCPTGGTSRRGRRTASKRPTQRANRIWKQLLAEYEPPPLDAGAAEALDAFVEGRKREITGGAR